MANNSYHAQLKFYLLLYGLFLRLKNSVTDHSSVEYVYGREDQQPFNIAARPTKGVNKSSDKILLEKFINHFLWTMEAAANIMIANKYWVTRKEQKNSMNQAKRITSGVLVLIRNFSNSYRSQVRYLNEL